MQLNSPLLMTAVLMAATVNNAGQISANIRLGDDPPQLPANRRAQAGSHIARSFKDPTLLVATFQEGRHTTGGAVASGYALSTDSGLSWTRALVPNVTQIDGGPGVRVSHPMAAIDHLDNLYLLGEIFISFPAGPVTAVLSTSTNHGATFAPPLVGFSDSPQLNKQWLAINTFDNSVGLGQQALAFTGGDGLEVRYNTNGPTWLHSTLATSPANSYGCQLLFLPDGTLVNVYFRYGTSSDDPNGPAQIECAISTDGGVNFAVPRLVADMAGRIYFDPVARTGYDYISATTDRQAGVIYVTYQALTGPATDRPGILFTRSIDKGATWSTPVAVNDTPADQGVFNPAIAVSPDGQHVTVCFYDKRHQTINSAGNLVDLYLAESFDGGETWQPNLRLSEVSSDLRLATPTSDGWMLGDYQGVVPALNANTPGVAVWIDTRAGNPDPYAVRIGRARGSTFDAWRKLRFSPVDLANLALSGEDADPEGDGLPNLAEYAFATEPTQADGSPLEINQSTPGPGQPITLAYERPAMLSDIEFYWESCNNLVDWRHTSPTQQQTGAGRDPSMERVEAAFATDSQMRFFRLGVARNPLTP